MDNVISIHGYDLHIIDGEAMVKDVDLANRLGYKEPRAIKKLIKRLIDAGSLTSEQVRDTVSRSKNGQLVVTFLLNEKAALKVITKSETEKADQITDEMIDVFIDYRSGNLNQRNVYQLPQTHAAALRELADQLEVNQKQADKIERLENFFQPGTTITAFGKMLNGVNCQKITGYCFESLDWLYNESRSGKNKRWRVRSQARDRYLTEVPTEISAHGKLPFTKQEPRLLQDGAKRLYQLYLDGELPMKKTWDGEYSHMKFIGVAA